MVWTGPLACLSLSSAWKWIRVRVFNLEYCSSPVLYYPLKVETRVKKFGAIILRPETCNVDPGPN